MRNFFESKIRVGLKIIDQPWFYPIVLLFVGLAAYGIIFTRPGFYWDDWTFVYLYGLHNPAAGYGFLPTRPFAGLVYYFMFSFVKMEPFAWEAFTFILRWLGVSFIYFTLNAIWPEHVWQNRWVGVLMFVYPGFLSQPVSVAFSLFLMSFLLLACSLFLTVQAIKHKRFFWLWMSLSVLLGFAQLFIDEYFVVLEIIRPLIIWFTLRSQQEEKKRALSKTLLYWLPFVIGLVLFMWWRFLYIPKTTSSEPNPIALVKAILYTPINGIILLLQLAYKDVPHVLASVWIGTFSIDGLDIIASKIARISWLLGIVAAVLFGLYIRRTSHDENTSEDHPFVQMLLLGSVALLAGAMPVWATGVQIAGGKWSDRFTLGPMLGAVILVVFLIDWLFRTQKQKLWLFAILLAASISLQVANTNKYRLDWIYQQNIYWQMSWRIPNLKPGTAVIGSGTFTDKSSFYDGGYIVNLLFSSQLGANAQYDYFDIWHLPLTSYQPNLPLVDRMQGSHFTGNTSQAIGMYFNGNNPNECVRILDSVYTKDPKFNQGIRSIIPISNLNEITNGGSRVPDPGIFGVEPPHTWCYYFEKADLARQMKDWKTVIQLGKKAEAKDFGPSSGGEYLPFIEAFAQTGQWSKANDLSLAAQKITPGLEPLLCNNWGRFQQITGGQDRDIYLAKAKAEFCSKTTP
ncbi:MAG: hypothetical protein ABSF99_02445 [Anaerolineales bacterium]|jgi:hypothetical protein